MARFQYMILSQAASGQQDAFEKWYRERHLADVCAMPGVVSGRIFRIELQKAYDLEAPQWSLMTLYELEGDDPKAIVDSIVAVSGSAAMPLTDALTKVGMVQVVGQQIAEIEKGTQP